MIGNNQIVIIGKFSEVMDYLKKCQHKYTYVQEMIDNLHSTQKPLLS